MLIKGLFRTEIVKILKERIRELNERTSVNDLDAENFILYVSILDIIDYD